MNAPAKKQETHAEEDDRTLVISRIIDAPPAKVFKAWSDPRLLKQWFAPRPWTTSRVDMDFRSGGSSKFTMKSPEGQEFPNAGVFLEIIPNEKIVFTDAYSEGWAASEKPFFTAIVTLEDIGGGKTKYTATARHWNAADCETHRKMGFHDGWMRCAAQLEEVAAKL